MKLNGILLATLIATPSMLLAENPRPTISHCKTRALQEAVYNASENSVSKDRGAAVAVFGKSDLKNLEFADNKALTPSKGKPNEKRILFAPNATVSGIKMQAFYFSIQEHRAATLVAA